MFLIFRQVQKRRVKYSHVLKDMRKTNPWVQLDPLMYLLVSRRHNCQNEKVYSLHVPAIKVIGKKQLVYLFPVALLKSQFLWYVKFGVTL